MKTITLYETFDGERFVTKSDAEQHEKGIVDRINKTIDELDKICKSFDKCLYCPFSEEYEDETVVCKIANTKYDWADQLYR